MDEDDLSELEMQGEPNEDIFIGFADEDEPQLARHRYGDESNDTESEVNFDLSTDNTSDDDDEDVDFDNENIDDSSFDDEDEELVSSEEEQRTARPNNQLQSDSNAPTTSQSNAEPDDDEEDDVIKKILANTKTQRKSPPDINIDDFVTGLSFHPEEDILAVATMAGDALIYKYSTDENVLVNTLELHTKAIRDIEFSFDGSVLYSTSKDRSILLTDVQTGAFKRLYEQAHEQPVSKMSVFDENLFATGDDDGTIKVWDIRERTDSPIFSLKEVDDYITSILTNDAKKVLVATSGDGYLTAINIGSRYAI